MQPESGISEVSVAVLRHHYRLIVHLQLTDWPYVRLLLVLLHSREDFLRSVSDGLCFLVKEVLMDSRHFSRSVKAVFTAFPSTL